VLGDMGEVSGFVFQAEGEPVVYWAGDTVWYEETQTAIRKWKPDVIITHSSGAVWGPEKELIVMDTAQTLAVSLAATNAMVIAVHMQSLDHGTVSRAELREAARRAGVEARLVVLEDGEEISLSAENP
jgi:L-ascorbate metabolism protein UlaG (beta-lactamase superfamily)